MKKLTYALAFAMLIMLSASSTRADVVPATDPRIQGGGGGSCATVDLSSNPLAFTVTAFELYGTVQNPGACVVDFVNETGGPLSLFTVDVNAAFSFALVCSLDPTQVTSPFTIATLTGPSECTFSGGVLPDEGVFGLRFGDNDGTHPFCLLDNTGTCNQLPGLPVVVGTPEPASIALMGTGLAALLARKKKLASKLVAS